MQAWAKTFYKSKAWHRCREAYIRQRVGIDGGICEECHDNIGYIVHHKTMLTPENVSDPEISLNEENLELVCKPCHDDFEGHGIKRAHALRPLVVFDSSGMPIRKRDDIRGDQGSTLGLTLGGALACVYGENDGTPEPP